MATLKSTDAWKIKIYADDHAPPHFHVLTADGQSLVDIATLQERQIGANKKALAAALLWAADHRALLVQVWHEQNSRTRP